VLLLACLVIAPGNGRSQESRVIPVGIIVVGSREEALGILDRLKQGADFAGLARERSTDPTASGGGYLGKVDPDTLRLELRDALRGVEPGQLSGVVSIPAGYAILKVLQQTGDDHPAPLPSHAQTLAISAPLSVRLTPVTSGYGEFLQSIRHIIPDNPAWSEDLKVTCDVRTNGPAEAVAAVREQLARQGSDADPLELAYTRYTLALLLASSGHFDESILEAEEAYRGAISAHSAKLAGHEQQLAGSLEEALGGDYLHRAMVTNHVPSPVDQTRIFPSHPGAPDMRPEDAAKAIEYFTKALKRDPENTELQYLLNFAYMTQGTYPSHVPKEFLIPPAVFASRDDVGRFLDVAPAAGINLLGTSGGAIADDFDNDGLLDVVTSQIDDCGPPQFFHNNGDGTFTNRTKQAGLSDQTGGLNIIQADYNNDGCVDLLVLRGGWEYPRRRSLLRNNCDGTFTDVTAQSGLLEPIRSSQSAVWADINNDGLLDLFIANEGSPSQLFLNKGDGTFVDIAHEAGVDKIAFSKAVVSADYDNDGYPDFFVSNYNGPNFLYHNNGNLTFTEVAEKAGVQGPWMSFPAWFFDYDNDGLPDLFVASYYHSVEEVARSYMGLPRRGETIKLYKNKGDGTFRDVTAETNLDRVLMPMGSNFGDVDNDGFLDIYLGNGDPSFLSVIPNVLLRNEGGKRFVDVSTSSGTGAIAKGHGTAFADFGNNGNEDILVVMGGPTVGDHFQTRLFRNPGNHGNDWITLHLVGVKSNRSAIGARITVTVENAGGARRNICRTVGTGGSFGGSPLQQHIGLGKSAQIENIEVWWPASKTRQNFTNVQPNEFLEIKEFAATYTRLSRPAFQMGGRAADSP
jgi:hypothetical protein